MVQSVCDDCFPAKGRSVARRTVRVCNFQLVALSQGAAFVASEPTEKVCRRATKKRLLVNSTGDAQIAARSRTRRTGAKRLPRVNLSRSPKRYRSSVQFRTEVGAGQRDDGAVWKHKCPAKQRHFQSRCSLGIANQSISQPQRDAIRGARGRDAARAESWAPQILHGGDQSRRFNLDDAHAFRLASNCWSTNGSR